mmetsp:Transcript_66871/g.178366  ORF Transcript_66871/g.178366 Transcript_66871/m.178366 type:complete len:357 (+) Transcript_66871:716-1786(+)
MRFSKDMHLIITGFTKAVGSVVWIAVLLFMFDFIAAVCLVRLIGHRIDLWPAEHQELLQECFGTVQSAMYTLFKVMTLADWIVISDAVEVHLPWMSIFFIAYVVVSAWTTIACITGIVSATILDSIQSDADRRMDQWERHRHDLITVLLDLFEAMDNDGSGQLERAEFEQVIKDETIQSKLSGAGIEASEYELLCWFDVLDEDNSQSVSREEFVSGFLRLEGTAKAKDVALLQHTFRKVNDVYLENVELMLRTRSLVRTLTKAALEEARSHLVSTPSRSRDNEMIVEEAERQLEELGSSAIQVAHDLGRTERKTTLPAGLLQLEHDLGIPSSTPTPRSVRSQIMGVQDIFVQRSTT